MICIGGSKGGRQGRAPPPWGSKFFHFHVVFGKNVKNNSNFGSWRPPWGKSWIRHWYVILNCSHGRDYFNFISVIMISCWIRINRILDCVRFFLSRHFLRYQFMFGFFWLFRVMNGFWVTWCASREAPTTFSVHLLWSRACPLSFLRSRMHVEASHPDALHACSSLCSIRQFMCELVSL